MVKLEIDKAKDENKDVERTKKIRCYFCKETEGTAKKVQRWIISKNRKTGEEKGKWIWSWQAPGFRKFASNLWLCDKCDQKRCKRCGILLSNKHVCRCGKKHGAFYPKHPEYCKECWDIIASQKKHGTKRQNRKSKN